MDRGTNDGLNKLEKTTGRIERVLTSSTNPELGKIEIIKLLHLENNRYTRY